MSWCEETRKYHPAGQVVAEENPEKLKFRVQHYYSKVKDIYMYWIGCYMCVKCWLLVVVCKIEQKEDLLPPASLDSR